MLRRPFHNQTSYLRWSWLNAQATIPKPNVLPAGFLADTELLFYGGGLGYRFNTKPLLTQSRLGYHFNNKLLLTQGRLGYHFNTKHLLTQGRFGYHFNTKHLLTQGRLGYHFNTVKHLITQRRLGYHFFDNFNTKPLRLTNGGLGSRPRLPAIRQRYLRKAVFALI